MKIIYVALLFVLTALTLQAGMQMQVPNLPQQNAPLLMAQAQTGLVAPVYDAIINLNNRTVAQRNGLMMAVQNVIQAFAQPGAARDAAIDAAVAANGGPDAQASAAIQAAVNMAHP